MSTYLNEADSDSDGEKNTTSKESVREPLSEEQVNGILETTAALKAEGNAFFSKSEFEGALEKYTAAVSLLKESDLPKDGLILLNRSATYLALKRYVPALNDANQGMHTCLTITRESFLKPYCEHKFSTTYLFCSHCHRSGQLEGSLEKGSCFNVYVEETVPHEASDRSV